MARPRVPQAVAKATAAAQKNPQRFRERRSPKADELGHAGKWLSRTPGAVAAFNALKRELPWLKESHRVVVEMAAQLRAQLQGGVDVPRTDGARGMAKVSVPLGLAGRQELRRLMSVLGATPADESRVGWSGGEEEDPDEAHFAQPPGAARPN